MIRDMRGVPIKTGDIILFHNIIMKVEEVTDGSILQIGGVKGNQAKVQAIPGKMVCKIEFNVEPNAAINGLFKLTQPEEQKEIEANNNRIGTA